MHADGQLLAVRRFMCLPSVCCAYVLPHIGCDINMCYVMCGCVCCSLGLTTGATRAPARMWWRGALPWEAGSRCVICCAVPGCLCTACLLSCCGAACLCALEGACMLAHIVYYAMLLQAAAPYWQAATFTMCYGYSLPACLPACMDAKQALQPISSAWVCAVWCCCVPAGGPVLICCAAAAS